MFIYKWVICGIQEHIKYAKAVILVESMCWSFYGGWQRAAKKVGLKFLNQPTVLHLQ